MTTTFTFPEETRREMLVFLTKLVTAGGSATRKVLPLATRPQDRARMKCKERHFAHYTHPCWYITVEGRAWLAEQA